MYRTRILKRLKTITNSIYVYRAAYTVYQPQTLIDSTVVSYLSRKCSAQCCTVSVPITKYPVHCTQCTGYVPTVWPGRHHAQLSVAQLLTLI